MDCIEGPGRFRRVMVVSAHPDDPEFGYGAVVARFVEAGADVHYVVCTDGSQGGEDSSISDAELTATRYAEQRRAAAFLGVKGVVFLGFRDGRLTPDVALRQAVAREIRRLRPDLVLTHLPMRVLSAPISHPDHQAVGEATLAAIDEDAGAARRPPGPASDAPPPHVVREVWLPGLDETDHYVDVTTTVDRQVKAVLCHRSQFVAPGGGVGATGWAPERLAMVAAMRARMRALGERSGRGYQFATRVRRLTIA